MAKNYVSISLLVIYPYKFGTTRTVFDAALFFLIF
jgi:hypothetical protein